MPALRLLSRWPWGARCLRWLPRHLPRSRSPHRRASWGPLPSQTRVASTVPANGDVNPYGVAVVRRSTGRLQRGHVLVSNFNARSNAQGTGTTIVSIGPGGRRTLFAHLPRTLPGRCPGGVGLTTALGVLRSGWVVVGSLPTTDGTAATAKAGCLIVLDSRGRVRETLSGKGINGPWDMTVASGRRQVRLFVTNVLNGTVAGHGAVVHRGTVVRITLRLRGTRPPQRVGLHRGRQRFRRTHRPGRPGRGTDRSRAGRQRSAVRRGHGEQPPGPHPQRLDADLPPPGAA